MDESQRINIYYSILNVIYHPKHYSMNKSEYKIVRTTDISTILLSK